MSRAGRKRKRGYREPNGRLQRHEDVFATVRAQPHRRRYGDAFRDQRAECELGRLFMDGKIEGAQYQAGVMYRAVVLAMRRAIMAPNPFPGSIDILSGISAASHRNDNNDAGDNHARSIYADTFRSLTDAGRPATLATNDIVVHDKALNEARGTVTDLLHGLNILARHFGLVGKAYARA